VPTALASSRQIELLHDLLLAIAFDEHAVNPATAGDNIKALAEKYHHSTWTVTNASHAIDGLRARLAYLRAKKSVALASKTKNELYRGEPSSLTRPRRYP